jgi:steroid delta-isomerase-like uncharacterized protein
VASEADLTAILRDFMEQVWNRGDGDAVDRFLAETYTIHSDPGDPWEGSALTREGFRERLLTSRAPFPDLVFELHECVEEGDRVAIAWTMRGTHAHSVDDLPATGGRIEVAGMTIYYFEGERIAGHRQVVDRLSVMRQLGLLNGM